MAALLDDGEAHGAAIDRGLKLRETANLGEVPVEPVGGDIFHRCFGLLLVLLKYVVVALSSKSLELCDLEWFPCIDGEEKRGSLDERFRARLEDYSCIIREA